MAITLSGDGIARANLAADVIDSTKLADDAVNSEHYVDASIDNAHLADDAVGVAELSATGTASSSTYLRGDNSWATVTSVGGATGVDFNDNVKARFGTGNDLEIYHDASNTYINENGTGDLIIKGTSLKLRSSGNEDFVVCTADGSVAVRHNDAVKLETKSDGVDITGELQCDSLDVDGAADFTSTLRIDGVITSQAPQPQQYWESYASSASTSAALGMRRSTNTSKGSHTAVDSGDYLGHFDWAGSDGTNFQTAVRILGVAGETFNGSSCGGEMRFFTVDHGTKTLDIEMTITHNGVINGDFNDTSDVNLKENIADMGSATSTIKALKPRIFDWKRASKGTGVAGFIAQEVAETIPKAVVGEDYVEQTFYEDGDVLPEGASIGDVKVDGNIGKCLNATAILAYAVKTIQELEARIETLENP